MIESSRKSLRSLFSDDLNPKRLPLNLSAGVLQGAIEVLLAASLASLIFSGSLEALFPIGITLALATGAIHLIGSAIFSSSGAIHSSMQDVPAVLVAVMLASVAASNRRRTCRSHGAGSAGGIDFSHRTDTFRPRVTAIGWPGPLRSLPGDRWVISCNRLAVSTGGMLRG